MPIGLELLHLIKGSEQFQTGPIDAIVLQKPASTTSRGFPGKQFCPQGPKENYVLESGGDLPC